MQGGSRYAVRLTYDAGCLMVYCACAYFAEFNRCKHLWAAVLEADRRGVLREAANGGALRLARDADPDDERELANWQFDLPEPPPPQTHPWEEYLADIRHSLDAKEVEGAGVAAGVRDPLRDGPRTRRKPRAPLCSNCFRGRGKKTGTGL